MPIFDETIWDNDKMKQLLLSCVMIETKAQAKIILGDLLTDKEIEELGNRLHGAKMLIEGKSYDEVQKETGMSTTTIAKISKSIKEGPGGYQMIVRKLSEEYAEHFEPIVK